LLSIADVRRHGSPRRRRGLNRRMPAAKEGVAGPLTLQGVQAAAAPTGRGATGGGRPIVTAVRAMQPLSRRTADDVIWRCGADDKFVQEERSRALRRPSRPRRIATTANGLAVAITRITPTSADA
jgi:hypothetical protein